MNIKPQVEIYGPVRRVAPGRAHGLPKPLMRAKTERGTASKLPRAQKPRDKRPYHHTPQDLREPGFKMPRNYIKPVGITAKMSNAAPEKTK